MTLEQLVKIAQQRMKEDPKAAHAEVRLQQYDEIHYDVHGTVALDNVSERWHNNEIYLG